MALVIIIRRQLNVVCWMHLKTSKFDCKTQTDDCTALLIRRVCGPKEAQLAISSIQPFSMHFSSFFYFHVYEFEIGA